MTPIGKDEFDALGFLTVVFHRDGDGRASGLTLFATAARGIELTKSQ